VEMCAEHAGATCQPFCCSLLPLASPDCPAQKLTHVSHHEAVNFLVPHPHTPARAHDLTKKFAPATNCPRGAPPLGTKSAHTPMQHPHIPCACSLTKLCMQNKCFLCSPHWRKKCSTGTALCARVLPCERESVWLNQLIIAISDTAQSQTKRSKHCNCIDNLAGSRVRVATH